jgi:hypothetical protein
MCHLSAMFTAPFNFDVTKTHEELQIDLFEIECDSNLTFPSAVGVINIYFE